MRVRFRMPAARRLVDLYLGTFSASVVLWATLFTIIVLGKTFVKTLSEISEIGISTRTQVFGGLAFVMLIAIWWTYFDDVAESKIRTASPLSSSPATNRTVWVYSHLPLTAAITAFGVASKKAVGVEAFGDPFKDRPWVQLRACLACGYIGCCDDSKGQHARKHHESTNHPTIASAEPDQEWAYCYSHDLVDPTWQRVERVSDRQNQ